MTPPAIAPLFVLAGSRLLLVACLVTPLALTLAPAVAAARPAAPLTPTALARPDPVDAAVQVGQTVTVAMYVQDVTDMYGVDIRFKFDPALLTVEDANPYAPGVQIQPLYDFLAPGFIIKRIACNAVDPAVPDCTEAGLVWFAATQLRPALPVSGSGAVAAITFRGRAPGVSAIEVTSASAADRAGITIPLAVQSGSVSITDAPPPTATPSPTPTTAPTPVPEAGTLRGVVFVDANRNGQMEPGETGLRGVTVAISRSASPPLTTVVSGPDGRFDAAGLPVDGVLWAEALPAAAYMPTTPPVAKVVFLLAAVPGLVEVSFGQAPRSNRLYLPIIK